MTITAFNQPSYRQFGLLRALYTYGGYPNAALSHMLGEFEIQPLMRRRFWLRGPKGSLCTPRDRGGGMGSLSRRDAVAKLPIWGLTCGYFRDLWTEKSKLASMLVVWSPRGARVPMAWGGCVGAAGYPMGCQIGRLTRHETPLARPSQATKISKPNRFAYPFRSRPRGVGRPLGLNLPTAKASSCRDTAKRQSKFGVRCPPPYMRVFVYSG